jgi:hypothetical protein
VKSLRVLDTAKDEISNVEGAFLDVAVKPRIFIENPNPCTIAIVPGSLAIAYRTSHR